MSQYQKEWDRLLISHWSIETPVIMGFVVGKFIEAHPMPPEFAGKPIQYLQSLWLKRIPTVGDMFVNVLIFVGRRSQGANAYLMGKGDKEIMLGNMGFFKWLAPSTGQTNRAQKYKRNLVNVPLRMRDLSKAHDWKTVK